MNKEDFSKKVAELQQKLKVGKSNYNSFGKYHYRSAEDILEAVKKELGELLLVITEDMVAIGDRVYKKVTSTLTSPCGEHMVESTAFAREDEEQKGMSSAQLSGSVSSYAKKYSLGNLLLLDDTKDDDATNTHGKEKKEVPEEAKPQEGSAPTSNRGKFSRRG